MSASLKERIIRHISMNGPLPVAEYMHWCMADKTDGYYQTQTVFGRSGDFVTAPEISQMFGELIGVWLIKTWETLGKPKKFNLVELGPGRGTLMSDVLRITAQIPEFAEAAIVNLVETSEQLQAAQKEVLPKETTINWHKSLNEVDEHPCLIFANEFLDVLPFRQYVKSNHQWHEQAVGLSDHETLEWTLTNSTLEAGSLPDNHENEPDRSVFELSTTREVFVEAIAEKVAKQSGAALLIDYGHTHSGFGDTFQALASHEYADPLEHPGKADLTSHVDFSPFAEIVSNAGCHAHPIVSQGEFLLKLGLLERAGKLGQNAPAEVQQRLTREAERLALPDQMGDLFKVFVFSSTKDLWPFEEEA